MLNSTTSIMVPTWIKHFKLTDKGFGDVLEISCRPQAHNLFAVGLNLEKENYRRSWELTLMLRHCQYASFRFTATMITLTVCVLVRRRAVCKALHSAFPFQLLSGNWLHKSFPHPILPLQVVAEYTRALPICLLYLMRRPGSLLPKLANDIEFKCSLSACMLDMIPWPCAHNIQS